MPAIDSSENASAMRVPSRALIEGPAAWIGSAMAEREAEWSYRLSTAETAEIETALKTVQARGLDIAEISRDDFPLPTLGPVLDRLRAEVLDGRGFVLVRGLPVEDRPIAESAMAYWGIGAYLGSARSQNAQGHLLGHVYDLGKGLSATNPDLRSYATAERQNFHIDRCDVVALLCLRRAKSGGLSSIVSSMAVHNVIAQRRPDLLERLYQPFPVDRRGEVPEGKAPFYEAPVFNEYAGYVSVLYSRLLFTKSCSRSTGSVLCAVRNGGEGRCVPRQVSGAGCRCALACASSPLDRAQHGSRLSDDCRAQPPL
jgi:Taurine catabolism dioxygenase TauD, TfdA family